jgi:tetratricopeptide (TPR) repeat protein
MSERAKLRRESLKLNLLATSNFAHCLGHSLGESFERSHNFFPQVFRSGCARRVAEGVGDHFRVYVGNLFEGWTYTKAGDPAAGRGLLEQALAFAEQIGTTFLVALGKACLAACCMALGEPNTVPALCQEALRVADKTSDRFAQAVAHRALAAAVALGTDANPQQADQAMGEAIRLFKEIEFRPELARTYVSYARLLQQWGQQDTAAHYLAEAIRMFQEMGMTTDLAQAEEVRPALP